MNNSISSAFLAGWTGGMPGMANIPVPAARNSEFLNVAERIRTEQAQPPKAVPAKGEESLESYKQQVMEKISQLPMSASSRMENISVQISDEGFEAMKNDPEYEAWVLDTLKKNFVFQNPWTPVCGGGYVIHRFGATKEDYRGESWFPGYRGGQGAAIYKEKAKDSFWEQRVENHKKRMELQQQEADRQRLLMKLRLSGGSISAAQLLLDLL